MCTYYHHTSCSQNNLTSTSSRNPSLSQIPNLSANPNLQFRPMKNTLIMHARNTHPLLYVPNHPGNMRHRPARRHQLHLHPTLRPHRHRPQERHRQRPAHRPIVQKPLLGRDVHSREDRSSRMVVVVAPPPPCRLPPTLQRYGAMVSPKTADGGDRVDAEMRRRMSQSRQKRASQPEVGRVLLERACDGFDLLARALRDRFTRKAADAASPVDIRLV
jgi:hypothetical protein